MKNSSATFEDAKTAWLAGRHLDCGRVIYESLTPHQRVRWASAVLSFCIEHSPSVPAVNNVAALAQDENSWPLAHAAFSSVRAVTLIEEKSPGSLDPRSALLLVVAENTAKVIYNASQAVAPFDHDAGWWLAECFADFIAATQEPEVRSSGTRVLLTLPAANAA
jgi:hypothetical protein